MDLDCVCAAAATVCIEYVDVVVGVVWRRTRTTELVFGFDGLVAVVVVFSVGDFDFFLTACRVATSWLRVVRLGRRLRFKTKKPFP